MKIGNLILSAFILSILVLGVNSCKGDESDPKPAITYLLASKSGDVIIGEEITLTASSQGSDFQWSCSGGSIAGEGKSVKWTAPNKVGTYTVSVSNGDGSTQTKELNVAGSYFFLFDKSSSVWGRNSSITKVTLSNGKAVVSAVGTDAAAFYYKELSQPEIPFSYKTKVAVNALDYMNFGTGGALFNFDFVVPETISGECLTRIAFAVNPGARTWRVLTYTSDETGALPATVIERQTADIFTENDQYHTIGVAITAEKMFIVNVDGTELYRYDLSTYESTFKLNYAVYQVSSGLSLLIDDFYLTTDGTILK
ncbi:MAG: hypothetical protein LBR81_09000 [Prevotellaceae bacterium]|jgi:hypothetical protein|nr:hypothetical protein [Prevotellaceae bacterium]